MNLFNAHAFDVPRAAVAFLPCTSSLVAWPARTALLAAPPRWLVLGSNGEVASTTGTALPATVWLVERGRLEIELDWGRFALAPGEFFVTEAGERVRAAAGVGTSFVALAPPPNLAMRLHATRRAAMPGDDAVAARKARDSAEPVLLADHGLVAALLTPFEHAQLVREVRERQEGRQLVDLATDLLERLIERQLAAEPCIARTAGRTRRHRRLAYARLARTRLLIEHGPSRDYTMTALARIAAMSVWHYVRSFGHVFGETPHRCLTRVRVARAATLLRNTELSIAAIVAVLGFENRCSFARLFQRHHGVSATEYRARHRANALPDSAAATQRRPTEVRHAAEAARP